MCRENGKTKPQLGLPRFALYKSNFDLDLSEEKIDEFLKKKGLKIYSYYIDTWKEKNDLFQFFLRVIWIN